MRCSGWLRDACPCPFTQHSESASSLPDMRLDHLFQDAVFVCSRQSRRPERAPIDLAASAFAPRSRSRRFGRPHRNSVPRVLPSGIVPGSHEQKNPAAECLRGLSGFSAPDRIRTCGLCLRRATLYPAELRAHKRSGGGISRVLFRLRGGIISLGSPSPVSSSSLPGTQTERAAPRPCLALLRMGFTMPLPLPVARCALTAPFHPCLCP
jgi:hypothetical protein